MDESYAFNEREEMGTGLGGGRPHARARSLAAASSPQGADLLQAVSPRPISGRYEGEMTAPTGGRDLLDLRVDIDERYANSPVMNRVSGDFFQVNRLNLPGSPPRVWRVYRESWILNSPQVTWGQNSVEITGTIRFWNGTHPPTAIRVHIPWSASSMVGPAEVSFSPQGGIPSSYSCAKLSDCFRSLNLEVDVCSSVNPAAVGAPLLPSYDVGAHPNRPADLPRRTLTISEVYREAGVCVAIRPQNTVIDDSAPQFVSWSDAELHHAMEEHFSQIGDQWPRWEMWGVLAGQYDDSRVGGVMFDASATFGGPGQAPERQGFAVFRNHEWFDDLPAGTPTNDDEAAALRKYLYTWVHEAGHAFNFLHSWDKNRPDSLSWMNYDWKYDNRNGTDRFWRNFRMRFDDEELIHVRHGNRPSVIMGGDPWASGGHMESPPGAEYLESPPGAMSHAEGDVPVEFLLRSKEYFEFMEPVAIECRLRNLFTDLPLNLDTNLSPEYGGTVFFIRRPDGRIVEYAPVMCKVAQDRLQTLQPLREGDAPGPDRFSENVFLSYGRYGYYFDEPGQYIVRALYQGPGDLLIPSNVLRLRVGTPLTKQEDRLAQDFFSYEVGMSLYLRGSQSPFLAKGMDVLTEITERDADQMRGARIAHRVAPGIARPFFRAERDAPSAVTLRRAYGGDPEQALAMTKPALEVYRRDESRAMNIPYGRLVRLRSKLLSQLGRGDEARREFDTLGENLAARGVNASVIQAFAEEGREMPASRPVSAAAKKGAAKKGAAKKSPVKKRR